MKKSSKKFLYIVALIFSVSTIAILIFTLGWTEAWSYLHVPSMYPPFADMRTIQGALTSISSGLDPQIINPGDPWDRELDYPMIWVEIAKLFGFDVELNYIAFICVYIAAFIICIVHILYRNPSVCIFILAISGSTLLALERGNNDILMFVLLYLAALMPFSGLSSSLILIGVLLKLYPVFSVIQLFYKLRVAIFTSSTALLYFAVNWDEIGRIRFTTPEFAHLSYGTPSVALLVNNFMSNKVPGLGLGISDTVISIVLVAASLIIATNKKFPIEIPSISEDSYEARIFLTGASIYVFTFIFSSNWDYRLIFLILCFPLLFKLENSYIKYATLASTILASNYVILSMYMGKLGIIANVFSKLFIFVVLSALMYSILIRSKVFRCFMDGLKRTS